MNVHIVVKPAYGDVYTTLPQVKDAWKKGRDFRCMGLQSGYVNIVDVQRSEGGSLDSVEVRYGKNLEKVTAFYSPF